MKLLRLPSPTRPLPCARITIRPQAKKSHALDAEPAVKLRKGAPVEGPDLRVKVNGLNLPNPFVVASGPPGTNYSVMKKAFDEGWGGFYLRYNGSDTDLYEAVTFWAHGGNGGQSIRFYLNDEGEIGRAHV